MVGKVKSFNKQKGYGFIKTEENEDIFFHFSSLVMEGYKTVKPETNVEFDLEETDKGYRATNIKIVE